MNESAVTADTAVVGNTPETVDATPETTSNSPSDISDVIRESLDGVENRDSDDSVSAAPAAPETPTTPEERDELAEELGLKPGSKNNRIPYNRVKAIVAKAEERYKQQLQEHEAKLASLAQYESPEFQSAIQAWQVADQDPKRFLEALVNADNRYAELVRSFGAQATGSADPQGEDVVHPDLLLPDGTLAYSPEAMQKLLDRKASDVERKLEQKFEEKFGPVAQDWRQNQLMRGAVSKAKNQIQQAESWPGFNDHKADILQALKSDQNLSLEQAYIKVVTPRLTAARDDIRKQVLAEVNSKKPTAARGTVAPSHTAVSTKESRSIEDVIRDSIAGLPRD